MFGIGFFELLIIGVVGLIIVGVVVAVVLAAASGRSERH